MKTLHTDSYKVPAMDSNHIVHVGGWRVLAPEDWGLEFYSQLLSDISIEMVTSRNVG